MIENSEMPLIVKVFAFLFRKASDSKGNPVRMALCI